MNTSKMNSKLFSNSRDRFMFYFYNVCGGILIPLMAVGLLAAESAEPTIIAVYFIVNFIICLCFSALMYTRAGKTIFSNNEDGEARTSEGRALPLQILLFAFQVSWLFYIRHEYLGFFK